MHISKDGVTVAKSVHLDDPIENVGAQLMKDVAMMTCKDAGDGTSSSVIFGHSMFMNGLKHIESGVNPF